MSLYRAETNIRDWLDSYAIKNYKLVGDEEYGFVVNVVGSVSLRRKGLSSIDVKFNKISGYFDCSHNQLTSLKGAPKKVAKFFNCCENLLTTLEHCPHIVRNEFLCDYNSLESLEFIPGLVEGKIFMSNNPKLGLLQEISEFPEMYKEHMRIKEIINSYTQLNSQLEEKKPLNFLLKI